MIEMTCKTCTFCRQQECHYNPPSVVPNYVEYTTRWPEVDIESDWCGKYYTHAKYSGRTGEGD